MRIKKLPYLSLLLSLALLIGTLKGHYHDLQQWDSIQSQYDDLQFELEAPLYLDYLKRRLNVDGLGNLQQINALLEAIKEKDNLYVIKAIVKDQDFTNYMRKSGSTFLQNETFIAWQEHRKAIEPYYLSTYSQQLGLAPSDFKPAQIFTHLFSHPFNTMLLLVLISLVIASATFENYMGTFKLYGYITLSAVSSSLAYLALTSENSLVLEGPLAIVFGLLSPLVIYFLHHRHDTDFILSKQLLTLFFLSTVGTIIYTVFLIRSHTYPQQLLLSSVMIPIFLGAALMYAGLRISLKEPSNNKTTILSSTDWPYRAEYAKALEFLSRFEFNSARQTLNALAAKYPESPAVLEQRYHLAKFQPEDTHYWKLAKDLIELCVRKNDYARICRLFNDIQKNAATKKRAQESLDPEHYHKVMALFVKQGDLPQAEQAFHFLELGGDKHIIHDACLMLIQEFKVRHTYAKQQQYEMLLERLRS